MRKPYHNGNGTALSPHYATLAHQKQCVFDVDFTTGLTLVEVADGTTIDEIKARTEAPFAISEDVKSML